MTTKYLRMIAILLIVLVCFIGIFCLLFGAFVVGYWVHAKPSNEITNNDAVAVRQVTEPLLGSRTVVLIYTKGGQNYVTAKI